MFPIDTTKRAKRYWLRLFDDNGRPVRTAKTFEWVGPWSSAKRNFCIFHSLRAHMPPTLIVSNKFLVTRWARSGPGQHWNQDNVRRMTSAWVNRHFFAGLCQYTSLSW